MYLINILLIYIYVYIYIFRYQFVFSLQRMSNESGNYNIPYPSSVASSQRSLLPPAHKRKWKTSKCCCYLAGAGIILLLTIWGITIPLYFTGKDYFKHVTVKLCTWNLHTCYHCINQIYVKVKTRHMDSLIDLGC